MYKFGIAYYEFIDDERTPITGLAVKLLAPGVVWANGIVLTENPTGSGYYESAIISSPGYYEIWDDQGTSEAFSGKTVQVGLVQSNGIDDAAVTTGKIGLGAVTAAQLAADAVTNSKIAADAVRNVHIKDGEVSLEKLDVDAQLEIGQIEQGISEIMSTIADMASLPIYFGMLSNPPVVTIPACPIAGRSYMEGDTYLVEDPGSYMSNLCVAGDHLTYDGANWVRIEARAIPLQDQYHTVGLFYADGIVNADGVIALIYNLVDYVNNLTQGTALLKPEYVKNFGSAAYAGFDRDVLNADALATYMSDGKAFTIIFKGSGEGNLLIASDATDHIALTLKDNVLTIATDTYTYAYPASVYDNDIVRVSMTSRGYLRIQINDDNEVAVGAVVTGLPKSTKLQVGDSVKEPFEGAVKYLQICDQVVEVDEELAKFISENTA